MASTSSSSNSPCACLPKPRSGLSALMTSRNGPDAGAGTGGEYRGAVAWDGTLGEGSETGGRFWIWRARMAASLLSSVQYGLSALGLGTGQPSSMASRSARLRDQNLISEMDCTPGCHCLRSVGNSSTKNTRLLD